MGGNARQVTDADFASVILKADRPAMIDFWAEWCKPCVRLAPTVEQLADDYAGRVIVAKLDIQTSPDTPAAYRVQSIPTLLFIKNGQEVDRMIGLADRAAIAARLDALLG